MVLITSIVNSSKAYPIQSDLFQGEIVANIKGITDEHGRVRDSEYFGREERQGVTWSIQVQGRFLVPTSADDILFGNTFDRPLKLPWGTGAILKFMHYIDPTLEHDLFSTNKPWALSPLICTMPYFMHTRVGDIEDTKKPRRNSEPPFPPTGSIRDSTDELYLSVIPHDKSDSSDSSSASSTSSGGFIPTTSRIKNVVQKKRRGIDVDNDNDIPRFEGAGQRRSYFSSARRRELIQFGPEDVITTDFCYGFIKFSPSLSLQLPGGFSLDLAKYWDGQPVRFMCCERNRVAVDGEEPWGRIFWCVAIEMVTDDEDK